MRLLPVLAMLAAFSATACTTIGKQLDPVAVATLKPGQSTYADVISKLGPPTSESMTTTGSKVALYYYSHTAARPESFIPFIGPLVGGADSRSNTVIFNFDPAGVLAGISSNNSKVGVGTGLLSGQP